jgi:hypothetical protein
MWERELVPRLEATPKKCSLITPAATKGVRAKVMTRTIVMTTCKTMKAKKLSAQVSRKRLRTRI